MGYSRKSRNIVRTEEEKDCCSVAGLSSICMMICLVKNSDGVPWRVIRPMQMQQASTCIDVKLNERQIVLHRKFWSHEVINQLKSMYSLIITPTPLR